LETPNSRACGPPKGYNSEFGFRVCVHTGKPADEAQGSRSKTSIAANGWYATIDMSGFGSHKSKDTRQQNWVV
jgi:hypothetical protein